MIRRWQRVALIVDWVLGVLERDADSLRIGLGAVRSQIGQ